MSISTRQGDSGQTSLLYGRRVAKTHPRIAAVGTVDELTALLGLARATARTPEIADGLRARQEELLLVGAELVCDNPDQARWIKGGKALPETALDRLDALVKDLEDRGVGFKGFVQPGQTLPSAHLHHARAVTRRLEREIWALVDHGHEVRPLLRQYLNRLADVLWLLAREDEMWHG